MRRGAAGAAGGGGGAAAAGGGGGAGGGGAKNQFLVCGALFEVDARWRPVKPIGKGAYGVVCSARREGTEEVAAIKKVGSAFDNVVDAKRILREIKLLRHLRHENIISIREILRPACRRSFEDVYIVYELMDTDLHQIIRSSQPLSDDHVQYFVYQLLRGLKYIHSAGVLHRDLKPSNLLLNSNCDLKICDFGLARTNTEQELMTEYVVTRWYRAPELLLSCSEYTAAIDVWSVGCILAELLGRKPLFPGKDYVHQLNLITKVLGSPSEEDLAFVDSEKAKRYMRSLPTAPRAPLSRFYPQASPAALDLCDRMLAFNPLRRATVEECLAHPYLASLHDPSDEPVCEVPFEDPFAGAGPGVHTMPDDVQRAQVRELVYQEC